MNDPTLQTLALQAPADLHVVLEDWFNARGSESPAVVLAHFDPAFRIISPAGKAMAYDVFAGALPRLRGSRAGLVMNITDVELVHSDAKTATVSYIEHQTQGDDVTRRLSTVLLTFDDAHHALWKHLQETWIA